MKTIMVRYKVSSEALAAENEALVRGVFDELRAREPAGIHYASYRLADGLTFVHIATIAAPQQNPLTELESFKLFQDRLKDRCVELPALVELSAIDSYGAT
jgi:hypothetical protein